MGLFDKIRGQFIDVIEWVDSSRETLVWKFPRTDNEIKNGAQLVVRETQAAVFMHEGQVGDVFGPGRVQLSTRNLPILTTLASWKYAFDAPFKCDVYFVNTRQFTDEKWGTPNPIMLRDPEFGPVRLRAFGSYSFRVTDAGAFIRQLAGTDPHFETSEIAGYFRSILVSRFADALARSGVPLLDLAAHYTDLGDTLIAAIQGEFVPYGLEIAKFLIENVSVPEDVEKALDKRASMSVLGNLNQYTQYQTAQAIGDVAKNPGSPGAMAGVIAGANLGGVMAGAMQPAAATPAPTAPAAAPPPSTAWYAAPGGVQSGPLDPGALQRQISAGQITPQTLVWRQGLPGWTPAGQTPELQALFASVPPPLPPPLPPAAP
jgi:membrane protease subunit (stomatin/prohibitin family)